MTEPSLTTRQQEPLVPYYVVKTIGGKKYVYYQQRMGNRVVTKYIGPLDKIVQFYLENRPRPASAF